VGQDFFLAFSPQRIDPGNAHFGVRDIPKEDAAMSGIRGRVPICNT
jgi:UDP-N-acetyl-D-glucosamine dehydrogenase